MGKKAKVAKQMATGIAKLSEDLISEIFVRLPGRSLMRCECVCKAWWQLIQSPNFVDMHIKRSNDREDRILVSHFSHKFDRSTHCLSIHGNKSFDLISSLELNDSKPEDFYIGVTGPCNGLFCVLEFYTNKCMLYNPSIGERKWLPTPIFRRPKNWNDEWIEHIQGFGLGSVSSPKDYKVVLFASFIVIEKDNEDEDEDDDIIEADPGVQAVIYDLSINCWRELECDCPDIIAYHESGVLVNGALHWTARRKDNDIIVCFDMSTEILQDLDVPEDLQGKPRLRKSLMVLDSCLALCAYTAYQENQEEQFVDVWVMKKSWSKQVRIGPLSGINCPLMLWKDEAMLLESIEGQLLKCSLETQEIEKLDVQGQKGSMQAILFQETLVSVL